MQNGLDSYHSVASDLVPYCWPMSLLWEARHICLHCLPIALLGVSRHQWVNVSMVGKTFRGQNFSDFSQNPPPLKKPPKNRHIHSSR